MTKRYRFRFSLALLMMAMAVFAITLGSVEWRRYRILRSERELRDLGFTILWQDARWHWIWPIIPEEAAFNARDIDNTWEIAGKKYKHDGEIDRYYTSRIWRLHDLGVKYCVVVLDGKRTDTSTSTISASPRE